MRDNSELPPIVQAPPIRETPAIRNIVVPRPVVLLLGLGFVCVFIVVPGLCIAFGVYYLVDSRASSRWPTAEGKVVSSNVESYEFEHTTGTGKTRSRRKQTGYRPIVVYEFSVSGQTYSSQAVSFGDYGSSDPSHARSIVGKYPAGAAVTVYYSPTNPQRSVLEPGVTWMNLVYALFGLPCFLFGVAGVGATFWLSRKSRRRTGSVEPGI